MLPVTDIKRTVVPKGFPLSSQRAMKPLVVFDMRMIDPQDSRKTPILSGAAMSLALELRKSGAATTFFMPEAVNKIKNRKIDFPKELKADQRPLIFALTLFDRLFIETQQEIKTLKLYYPKAKIIIGGPSINTCNDMKALASFFPEADALVKGDGEKVISQLVKAISTRQFDHEAIKKLKGVYVREYVWNDYFEHCDEKPNVLSAKELNAQPGIVAYPALIEDISKNGFLRLHTSRSCKYRCIFCSHKYHPAPIYWRAERIIEELGRIKKMVQKGILPKEALFVHFNDDDFFQDRERAVRFLEEVVSDPALNNVFRFSFQGSVGSFYLGRGKGGKLDEKLIDLLSKVKRKQVNIGTDGFHKKALKYFKKGDYTWEMALKLIREFNKKRIRQNHFLILTYPFMTRPVLLETLENVMMVLKENRMFSLQSNIGLTAYEGAGLFELARFIGADYIYSEAGAKKMLPLGLPLSADNQLQVDIQRSLQLTMLPDIKQYREFIKASDSKRARKFMRRYIKHIIGRDGRNTRAGSVLKEKSRRLQLIAFDNISEFMQFMTIVRGLSYLRIFPAYDYFNYFAEIKNFEEENEI